MKRLFLTLILATALTSALLAQELPQFSHTSFAGWSYNSSSVTLTTENISRNKVVLYVSTSGKVLKLISPTFDCTGGEVIDLDITWFADQWQNEGFDPTLTALTVAVQDPSSGATIDSVTCTPTSLQRQNLLEMRVTIPDGMTQAQLCFVSWRATASNCGAVRKIVMTRSLAGDVNGDGEVSVADVNAIIDMILTSTYAPAGDVNDDQEVTVADVNAVIDLILNN